VYVTDVTAYIRYTDNQLTKTFQNNSILMKNNTKTIILVVFWVCEWLYCGCAKTVQKLQFCHHSSEHN
jgi:hypothetical protein